MIYHITRRSLFAVPLAVGSGCFFLLVTFIRYISTYTAKWENTLLLSVRIQKKNKKYSATVVHVFYTFPRI